jgi:DNA uptake protein ComE-like DNA-binding protein
VLAQDLGGGRPDLGREYDDGGLVDIISAQAKDIATRCGIDLAQAEAIVELRDERGGFANVDEMLVLVDLPVSAWDRIRDRAIIASA